LYSIQSYDNPSNRREKAGGGKQKMAEILEIIMIVSFGVSWPINVIKSYKARTAKGKSLWFMILILFGYVAGIASKFANVEYMANFENKWYVLFFYVLNFIMVSVDLGMYIRNYRLDKKREMGMPV
jgi:hypothetical protein